MLKELFSNRLFIGALAFLILCVVGGTLYISHVEKQDVAELATDEAPVKQLTEKQQQQPTAESPVGEQPPQGHFHEDGTWHGEPPAEAPVAAEVDPSKATAITETSQPAMQLTYHAELLKSNPVEALRQQGKERGHWSADYLPDFPLNDTEAMEIARAEYHYIYYGHTIPVSEHHHSPEFQGAARENSRLYDAINERYPLVNSDGSYSAWDVFARHNDLKMLAWPVLPYDPERIEKYRDYTYPSFIVRTAKYPDLPELGERR